jgi:hypothetical protein
MPIPPVPKVKYMNARNREEQYRKFLANITSTKSPMLKEQVLQVSKDQNLLTAHSLPAGKNEGGRYPKVVNIEPPITQ